MSGLLNQGVSMKKVIAFTIGAVVVLSVAGCTKTETTNTTVVNEVSVNDTLEADNASINESDNASNAG
jgi:outer membrane murein-binding lipoprotein Lpp